MTAGTIHREHAHFVRQLDDLYAEREQRGARLSQGIARQPWGNRDSCVFDPSGNKIKLTKPLETEE
ncbi:MAG TPA: VOC family protein [Bryobacteraceae bacterium]|nr:VOC family protein [Bryobacteraceae bacterium]